MTEHHDIPIAEPVPDEDVESDDNRIVAAAEAAALNPTVVTEDNTEDED